MPAQNRLRLHAIAAFLIVTAHTQQASAENVGLNEETGLFVAEAVLLPLAVVPAIVAATANATLAAKGKHPSLGWQILGWTTGGVNTGVGLLFSIAGATTDRTALWIAGLGHLVLGVTTLALTFWGWTIPEPPPVLIGPYIGFDRGTGRARIEPLGLSVSVMAW